MTLDEEIMHMLRMLNGLSRRIPKERPGEGCQSTPEGCPPQEHCGRDHGREHGRGRLMGLLNDEGPMSQSRLADRLEIRPQSLSEMLTKIEGEGLILRRQSEEDKRQTIVELTEAGKTRVEQFRVMHRRHAEEFLGPLSEEEKQSLAGILKKLIETRIEEEKKQGGR